MKLGIELKIDVTKINKERIYHGKKGKYLSLVSFVDTEKKSRYGDNGIITQGKNRGETVEMPILGNAKIFWREDREDREDNRDESDRADVATAEEIPF